MIKTIRLLLKYNTYCIWLYDEDGDIIGNDNPPEWNDDTELTNAFMAVSDLYDTFFIDNEKEFKIGEQQTPQSLHVCGVLFCLFRQNQQKSVYSSPSDF